MDFSKFKTSDWLIVGGGVAMLVAGFLPWVKASVMGFSDNGNAFDFFWTGTLPWILLIAAAVVTVLVIQGTLKQDMAPWTLILLVVTALALLLLLIRLIFNPLEGKDQITGLAGGSVSRQIGLYLAVLAGIASVAGSYLNFQASGGDLKDLTDVNKLKSSFNKGDDAPPPPPPPAPGGDVPPPPPPA